MRKDLTGLQLRPGDGALKVGVQVQLNLFAVSKGGGTDLVMGNLATWSSSDDHRAEVNRQGRLTPRRPGTVTITASHGGLTVTATFTVGD